jgi:hypothetical protein
MSFRRAEFDVNDLVKADTSNECIHATGGPILKILSIDELPDGNRNVLCEWTEWSWNGDSFDRGETHQLVFSHHALRRMAPFDWVK